MASVLNNVVKFFKTRRMETFIWPQIKIDYDRDVWWNADIQVALNKQWEDLRSELDKIPSVIKNKKWNRYRTGMMQEEFTVEIEGVVLDIEGPYYSDPEYKAPPEPEPQTPERKGNEAIDDLLIHTSMVWAITRCSDDKFNTLIEFLRATRRSGQVK